ncbi:MAG TPA: outer membrane protein transport protein [Planctomycetota bacterium]|nr:outer membrane protein transport protein [Planctomycetota bacterium]
MLASAASVLASNGSAPIAIGARAAGRGGADTAIADDALDAVMLNPAGLMRLGRFHADLQDMVVYSRDRFRNSLNDTSDSDFSWLAPGFGVAIDPRWGEAAETPIQIGFAVAGTNGTSGRTRAVTSVYPDGETEQLDFALVRVGPAIALEPIPGLRAGFGLFYNYLSFDTRSATTSASGNANGRVRTYHNPDGSTNNPPTDFLVNGQAVTWNDIFNISSSPDSNSAALYHLDVASAHGFSFNLGLQFDPLEWLSLGLSYTSQTFFFTHLRGKAEIDASSSISAIQSDPQVQSVIGPVLNAYLPSGSAANFRAKYDYDLDGIPAPQMVSLGAAFFPHPRITLALDGRWYNYSAVYSTLHAKLTGGDNPDINEINGSNEIRSSVVEDWKDVFTVGGGISASPVDGLVLRCGYEFATDPLPHDKLSPGTTPFLQHHVTFGLGVSPIERLEINAALVWALPREIHQDTNVSNKDFSNANLSAEQVFLYLGASFDF